MSRVTVTMPPVGTPEPPAAPPAKTAPKGVKKERSDG